MSGVGGILQGIEAAVKLVKEGLIDTAEEAAALKVQNEIAAHTEPAPAPCERTPDCELPSGHAGGCQIEGEFTPVEAHPETPPPPPPQSETD